MSYRKIVFRALSFTLLFLTGCAGITPTPTEQTALGIDCIPCAGKVEAPVSGFVAIEDPELLESALKILQ